MIKIDLGSADESADRVVDRLFGDPMEFERFLVDCEAQPLRRHAVAIVDVDDEVDRFEGFADFRGQLAPARRVGPIDFGQQRREDGRPGRDFDDLDRSVRRQRHIREPVANVKRNRMAGARPFAFRLEIDRKIPRLRIGAKIIVAHKAVEVEWRGRPRVGLDRCQLGQVLQPGGRRHQRPIRLFERGAFRQVDDHLDFRLVVERQQFDRDILRAEQRANANSREPHRDQEYFRAGAALQ